MDFQAIYVIWLREMKRFSRDKGQMLVGIVRPLTWLFFVGSGLSASFHAVPGANYRQFMLPGITVMAVLFTSIQSSISIIWDREFGFLKEMLVAPIPRTSIVMGKALGGTTLAITEGGMVLLLAPLIGVPIHLAQGITCVLIMILLSFALSAMGITIASRMRSFEGFGAIMNFVVMPLFFLSGALFPINGLPIWLRGLVLLNPLAYGVDLIRGSLLHIQQFHTLTSLIVLTGFTGIMMAFAVYTFNHQDL